MLSDASCEQWRAVPRCGDGRRMDRYKRKEAGIFSTTEEMCLWDSSSGGVAKEEGMT